jgi:hypothetical protein
MKTWILELASRWFRRGNFSSASCWGDRYAAGGTSGPGSYGELAAFKAEVDGRQADLALSLDMVFHLIEDRVYDAYMRRLFEAGSRCVIVHSSVPDEPVDPKAPHVRHRRFSRWVAREMGTRWTLLDRIPNAFPDDGDYRTTSFCDFFIHGRTAAASGAA